MLVDDIKDAIGKLNSVLETEILGEEEKSNARKRLKALKYVQRYIYNCTWVVHKERKEKALVYFKVGRVGLRKRFGMDLKQVQNFVYNINADLCKLITPEIITELIHGWVEAGVTQFKQRVNAYKTKEDNALELSLVSSLFDLDFTEYFEDLGYTDREQGIEGEPSFFDNTELNILDCKEALEALKACSKLVRQEQISATGKDNITYILFLLTTLEPSFIRSKQVLIEYFCSPDMSAEKTLELLNTLL